MDELKKLNEAEVKPEVGNAQESGEGKNVATEKGGTGWGLGFSPLSYLSDLQKAATVAAEEISRNAVEAAKIAAKSIADSIEEDSETSKEESKGASVVEADTQDENYERRMAALDKLEKASQETLLSQGVSKSSESDVQGLKVIDTSVESFASGAWQALGTAWKGIENSATNITDSIQHGVVPGSNGAVAPSLLESGKAFVGKGLHVLEQVGKETMDLIISDTGVGKRSDGDDQLTEEVSFDRCFYIYGGPEQLEELEALSNHYALLYNRRKAKLSPDQKSLYEGKLKEVQNLFSLHAEFDGSVTELEKGKKIEAANDIEWKKIHDSSVRKAAELASGLASALSGLAPNDIVQKTSGRLDALHSEGVHRLSEMCCLGVTQLLILGRSMISNSMEEQNQEIEEMIKFDWPEDCLERAKIVRTRTASMLGNMESVFNSFITGISDITESYLAATTSIAAEALSEKSVQEKANAFTKHLQDDHKLALGKMEDGLQCLIYVVLATSLPAP